MADFDLMPDERRQLQMQNLWSALAQSGAMLMAAGAPVSDGQRAMLLAQSAMPFANMGQANQEAIRNAQRERMYDLQMRRMANQDQASADVRKMADDPEFQASLGVLNPAQRAIILADLRQGKTDSARAMLTPAKPTEADQKRAEILRAVGGDQETADRIHAGVQKMVVGPDGQPYVVNVATGQVLSGSIGQKPMTEGQSNAALYADRMRNSEPIILDNSVAGQNTFDKIKAQVPGVGNYLVSEGFQKYDQARRDFINATLRRESGAVISDAEFDNANKQYFPQPGDSDAVLKQKAENRRIAIEGISRAAGPSYKPQATGQQGQDNPLLDEARQAIARGAPRDAVIQRLRERGVDAGGL